MLSNIASLYLSQNRLDEAETYASRALAIKETLDLSSEPWTTYNILAKLAEKRGRMDEVRAWWRKEQESRMAFERQSGGQANTSSANIQAQVDKWNPVIGDVVSICRNGTEPSLELSQFLEKTAQTDDWKNLIAVIRRVLSGERGAELFDGLDAVDSAIVRRVLQALSSDGGRQTTDYRSSSVVNGQAKQQGLTLPQLLELVERAAGGERELGEQLFPAMQKMASDTAAPLESQKLGKVLVDILAGVRDPSLDDLPDEVASAVRGLLGRLKKR